MGEKSMKDKSELKTKNKEILNEALKLQKESKKNILSVMQAFAESEESLDDCSVNELRVFLEDLKTSIELCNNTINMSEKLIDEIDNPKASINNKKQASKQTADYNSFNYQTIITPSNITSNATIVQENTDNTSENNYKENTLLISETTGKVIMPYTLSALNQTLKDCSYKYNTIDDIINKEYTVPISKYKNPFISRFKESYKLMRKKEKSTVKDAFDLGLELMTNYNLHPAIISACKNVDELDIYLDYLESGETDKFKIFNIEFNVAPTVVKRKRDY